MTYTIGGTITGLTGSGLVLQNNAGNNLTVSAGATAFTFATAINSGAAYNVSILTQPSAPAQTCVVTGGSGTASGNVTNVQIVCSLAGAYTISGTISGLTGTGLILQNNGGSSLNVGANGAFTFSTNIISGSAYSVTAKTQPTSQICSVYNGVGIVASANVSNVTVYCATPPSGGTGSLAPSGGTVTTSAAIVTAPVGATVTQQTLTISTLTPPTGLPKALVAVGAAVNISVDNAATINAPFVITLPYDPTGIPDETEMAVVHYNTTAMRYEPVTILKHDLTAHSFQFDSRNFSPFAVVAFAASALDASHTVTNFRPATNGWNIPNFGSYFTPSGNCLGMSAYATWYFDNNIAPSLSGAYSTTGTPSIAQILAIRTQLAQSQYWARQSSDYLNQLGPVVTAELMKLYLDVFDQPLVLLLGTNGSPQHAGVLYGYGPTTFQFYDVNIANSAENLTFNGTTFGTYTGYNSFTFVALPSLGRTEDFSGLTAQAVAGFTSSSSISVSTPTPGQQINSHSVSLEGTLSSSLNSNATVIAYVKGIQQTVSNSAGSFSATLPIANGDNPIVLIAGENISLQSNWYLNGAALIFDVTGTLPSSKLLTTLTWNQENTDVDLYVTEPSPSGQTAWFANKTTSNRLSLDFDNTTGYGPEHTTLTTTGTNPGTVLPGEYVIAVHYYSDHSTGQPATGTVSIVLNEGTSNQQLTSQSFTIPTSNSANAAPGDSGTDWIAIGTVNLATGTITPAHANDTPVPTLHRQLISPFQYQVQKPAVR